MRLGRLPRCDWRKIATHHQAASEDPITHTLKRVQPISGLERQPASRRPSQKGGQMQQEIRTADRQHLRYKELDDTEVSATPEQAVAGATDEAAHG